MDNILADICSSRAQTKIVITLASCPEGLPLRLLSRVSSCELRSTQLVVKSLLEIGLLERTKLQTATVYKLSCEHQWFPLIQSLANEQRRFLLQQRIEIFCKRSKSQFEFCQQSHSFIK